MDKQKLIDMAVEQRKGRIGEENQEAEVILWDGQHFYAVTNNYAKNALAQAEADLVCTVSEFLQRAKGLGWINGYKWGVEYPTNGKMPDLQDGLQVEWITYKGSLVSVYPAVTSDRLITAFRIVDERYKPIKQEEAKASSTADWYDYEQQKAIAFPPEKTRCQVEIGASWQDGLLIASNEKTGWFVSDFGGYMMLGVERFRPLDHATRTKELEKKRVVDAFMADVWQFSKSKCTFQSAEILIVDAYEKGFLKLPESKQ